MLGSLLVGLLDNFGKAFFPEFAYFTLFAPMAVILAVRPTGLFGRV
jgi:branched-chain amino acid transport system permease protein